MRRVLETMIGVLLGGLLLGAAAWAQDPSGPTTPGQWCAAFPMLINVNTAANERGGGLTWSVPKHNAHTVLPAGWTAIGGSVNDTGQAAWVVACKAP
jgi:hypothetical protein